MRQLLNSSSSSSSSITTSDCGSRVSTGEGGRGEANDVAGTASRPKAVAPARMPSADGAAEWPTKKAEEWKERKKKKNLRPTSRSPRVDEADRTCRRHPGHEPGYGRDDDDPRPVVAALDVDGSFWADSPKKKEVN